MNIGWPQGILLFIIFVSMGISIARFGERKTDHYDIIDAAISPAVLLALLYWGGFFGGSL